jgi:2,4-dienoyl-CoA reductase-like NADH-dependent reductase (Old Yellow Enzyme family)/thioredoxin reductase
VYPHLFSPIQINRLTLRNRVVLSPHTTGFAAAGGYLTEREAAYQAARARGGVGLTVLGTNVVHRSSTLDYGVLANFDDSYITGYRLVADSVHAHGARIFAQLNHQGSTAVRNDAPPYLSAPTPFASYVHNEIPQQLDRAAIREIVNAFGAAAERCKRGGMDGVLIHAAHGYLLNQFLSPLTNHRTDEYGGMLENRMRALVEVLRAVRNATGPEYPVGVRLSVDEYMPGGLQIEDSIEIAGRLDAGMLVDYLDVSTGVGYDFYSEAKHYPGMQFPPLTWVELAAEIKRAVKIPVACAGRIRTPQEAEDLLQQGKIDLAQIARALIADPEWVNKAREARESEIRPCMYISSGCLGRLHRGLAISCVQNPTVGREREFEGVERAERAKRVLVIGGGPAGMQAAVTARQRGHEVVLLERETQLGGQARIAAKAPQRGEILNAILFLERELKRLGVDVRLGQEGQTGTILNHNPDAVIVATGAEEAGLELENADRARMFSARQVLDERVNLRGRVVVVDGLGRIAASSAAQMLAMQGCEVVMTARGYAVGAQIDSTTRPAVESALRACKMLMLPGKAVVGYRDRQVTLRDGFTGEISALAGVDALVYDMGGRANDALYHALVSQHVNVLRAGDCVAPRGMEEAWREGFESASAL